MRDRLLVTAISFAVINFFLFLMIIPGGANQPPIEKLLPLFNKLAVSGLDLPEAHMVEVKLDTEGEEEPAKAEEVEHVFRAAAKCVACHGNMRTPDKQKTDGVDPKFHRKHQTEVANLTCVDCHRGEIEGEKKKKEAMPIALGIHRMQKGSVRVNRSLCPKCHGKFPGDSPGSLMQPVFKELNCLKCHGGAVSAGQPPQLMHDKPYLKPLVYRRYCLNCHGGTELPNVSGHDAADWIKEHPEKSANVDDCKKCHLQPELNFCAQCHEDDWAKTLKPSGGGGAVDPAQVAAGKTAVQKVCSQCHGLEQIESASHQGDQWGELVGRMKGKGCSMSPDEEEAITTFLKIGGNKFIKGPGLPPIPAGGAAAGGAGAAGPDGKATTQKICSQCHGTAQIKSASHQGDQWKDLVGRMKGKGCSMKPEEETAITEFLKGGGNKEL